MSRLILFNKPFDVLSQFTDAEGRKTLRDFIPLQGVYPAGRLDRDSEGLLLLTDDGSLQHLISHPKHKMAKTYWVQVEGDIDEAACQALVNGVQLKDGSARALKARPIAEPDVWPRTPPIRRRKTVSDSWLELVIDEGRNRQVRRMTAAVGFPTLRLIRYAIGEWSIKDIANGEWQEVAIPDSLQGEASRRKKYSGSTWPQPKNKTTRQKKSRR